jgi:hypothetical protein
MSPKKRERLVALIQNPPQGSKIAAAKEYGVDLTLLVENLCLTPTERMQKHQGARRLFAELRRAGDLKRRQTSKTRKS